jgi:hypothetical protein
MFYSTTIFIKSQAFSKRFWADVTSHEVVYAWIQQSDMAEWQYRVSLFLYIANTVRLQEGPQCQLSLALKFFM